MSAIAGEESISALAIASVTGTVAFARETTRKRSESN